MLYGRGEENESQNESQFLEEYYIPCFCSRRIIYNMLFYFYTPNDNF